MRNYSHFPAAVNLRGWTVVYNKVCKFFLKEIEKGVSFLELYQKELIFLSLKGGYTYE
jgi:hypothetical protein